MFAVVQDEEGPRRSQGGAQRGARIGLGDGRAPQGVEQDPDQVRSGRDIGQGGHVHRGAAAAGRHGLGECGLADAARPGDGDQLAGAQGLEDGCHILLAAQEVLGSQLKPPAHGALRGQGRLVGGAHRRARHGPLLPQPEAVVLVDLQGGRGRAHPGLGAHERGQDGLVAGVAVRRGAQQGYGLRVLAGGLQGEGPVAPGRARMGGGPPEKLGQGAGDLIARLGRSGQAGGQLQHPAPLARLRADVRLLRASSQVSGVNV